MLKIFILLACIAIAQCCRAVQETASGGIAVDRTDHSSVVLIETFIKYDRKYFCVGVLISSNYILTTARCVIGAMFVNIHVNAFKFFDVHEAKREIYRATEITFKEPFDRYINHNDIALVKLPVTLNLAAKSYSVAKLPTTEELPVNAVGKSVGWGLYDFYDEDEYTTTEKNEIDLEFISDEDCRAAYGARINETNIGRAGRGCLKKLSGNNCVSGYGSPFFVGDLVYALHSFGAYQYCINDLPNGVTLIDSYHLPWIRANSDVI